MPFINLPSNLQTIFQSLSDRVLKLEMANRFTAPNVDFATETPANPRVGDQFYDTNAQMMKYWNGTAWVELADNLYGTTVNAIATTMQSANNNMVYTGNPVDLDVQRIGKMITVNALITFTNVTNFGTGQYYFNLPSSIPARAHDLAASGFITQGGNTYSVFGTLGKTATQMYLWHPTSNGGSDIVTHNKPVVLNTTGVLNITGVALLA
jgi:hypothetical protein